jgi:hypothetical protein
MAEDCMFVVEMGESTISDEAVIISTYSSDRGTV